MSFDNRNVKWRSYLDSLTMPDTRRGQITTDYAPNSRAYKLARQLKNIHSHCTSSYGISIYALMTFSENPLCQYG